MYVIEFLYSGVFIGVIMHRSFYSDHDKHNSCFFLPISIIACTSQAIPRYLILLYFSCPV